MADNAAELAFLQSMQHEPAASDTTPKSERSEENDKSPKQPRTMGGFVVEDDEDDEADTAAQDLLVASSNGLLNVDRGSSNTPQRSPLVESSSSHAVLASDTISSYNGVQNESGEGIAAANAASVTDPVAEPNGITNNTVPNLAAILPETGASNNANTVTPSQTLPALSQTANVPLAGQSAILPKARLTQDRVGILEDKIKDDPRGDTEAWLNLIAEHRKRNRLEDTRAVYERFFKIFPSAAEQWIAYANMELELNNFYHVEQIFNRSLLNIPHLQLWSTYMNYIRRRNPLTTDFSGNARQIVSKAYEAVLNVVGLDKDAGSLWQDYIQFIRAGPGQIGGTDWQDQQKMDLLRKTYQHAICIPTQAINGMWREYDNFEMGLNKSTGRKFLQEKSPSYMTARSSETVLQNLTRGLIRTTLPCLPPALGFEGDVEYVLQVDLWKKWIEWEKEDPLVLKDEDKAVYEKRVMYVYKQALMALRFWPEMWFDAAEFCFKSGLDTEGNEFLLQGTLANPESCLLAFKRGERIEMTTTNDDSEDSIIGRGKAVREPYDKVLDALYGLVAQVKEREATAIARIQELHANQNIPSPTDSKDGDDVEPPEAESAETAQKNQVEAVKKGNEAQIKMLSKTISFAWIALMRAIRRIQGKGRPGEKVGGFRQVFAEARKRGRLTSDFWVACAMIEHHCYKDVAATKLFERCLKLFPEDEQIALEYSKHLIAINDATNARVIFETTVNRLAQKPETLHKAKPLYAFYHEYESHYGELSQVNKLEKRMADLFPDDPHLKLFSQRYAAAGFDPTAIRPILSPSTQARPKAIPSIEVAPSVQISPRPPPIPLAHVASSPKRLLEDSDNESVQPRKIPRGESPLKGAAGRRLDAQKRTMLRNEVNQFNGQQAAPAAPLPAPLPRDVMFLLNILPPAGTYNASRFLPEEMVNLLRKTDLAQHSSFLQRQAQTSTTHPPQPNQFGFGQIPAPPYGYNR